VTPSPTWSGGYRDGGAISLRDTTVALEVWWAPQAASALTEPAETG
jgi:hypothetical protein